MNSTKALRNMLAAMVISGSEFTGESQAISTDCFQAALPAQFRGGNKHEDAEEFLSYLLNTVSEFFESDPSSNLLQENIYIASPSNPAKCLQGSILQTCVCSACKNPSIMKTPFFFLQIAMEYTKQGEQVQNLVDDCLKEVLETETYVCNHCGPGQNYRKSHQIELPPENLGLHLKYFSYVDGAATKPTTKVDISTELKLRCSDLTVDYTLFAVIYHDGMPGQGHYISAGMCSQCAASAKTSDVAAMECFRILDDQRIYGPMKHADCMKMMESKYPYATPYLIFYAKHLEEHAECTVCKDKGARLLELARNVLPPASAPPPSVSHSGIKSGGGENCFFCVIGSVLYFFLYFVGFKMLLLFCHAEIAL